MDDREYRIDTIKKLLTELNKLFYEREQIGNFYSLDDDNLKYRIVNLEDDFKEIAKRLFIICKTHLEKENTPILLSEFKNEFEQFWSSNEKLFDSEFDHENAESYSKLISMFNSYLIGFPGFWSDTEDELIKRTGLVYLENILESTNDLLKNFGVIPEKERDIFESIRFVLKSVFLDHSAPVFKFQSKAKCYFPDMLVPSLNAAIEYKYATTEKELINCVDQILIDVEGYNKHPIYYKFYAVFYLKGNFCSTKRAKEIWDEKEFPKNWKSIFVPGN